LGSGGHARVVIAALRASGVQVSALHDQRPERHGQSLDGVTVAGGCEAALTGALPLHIAIGRNAVRRDLAITAPPKGWMRALHPTALIDPAARVGAGSLAAVGAII